MDLFLIASIVVFAIVFLSLHALSKVAEQRSRTVHIHDENGQEVSSYLMRD